MDIYSPSSLYDGLSLVDSGCVLLTKVIVSYRWLSSRATAKVNIFSDPIKCPLPLVPLAKMVKSFWLLISLEYCIILQPCSPFCE